MCAMRKLGNRAGVDAVGQADITLCLGTDFAWTQFYPPRQHVIQIDIDPTHLGRRAPIHMGMVGDVATTIQALLPHLDEGKSDKHLCLRNRRMACRAGGRAGRQDAPMAGC